MTNEVDIQNTVALSAQMLTQDKAQTYELVGMLKMGEFVKKVTTVGTLKILSEIKELKKYKGLDVIDSEGNSRHVGTWADFCDCLGFSVNKVDEDLQNLNLLGEDFLETSQRIGLGYRDLRKLRKLPEDERELIINGESIKVQDKEELIELIEERALAHAKEKESLEAKLTEAQKNTEAQEKIIADKNKKIDALSVTAEKEKLKLASISEEEAILQKYHTTWGEISGNLMATVFHAHQVVNQATEEELLPYTFLQKMLIDVSEARNLLLEMIDLLPETSEPVDTAWLTGEKEDE